jgi:transcriptional regulator with XRE-family HTH domain
MSIGVRIKEIRNTAGLTLKQFAEKIGISDSAISQMEKEKSGVSDQTIKSICREFHVNETWLRTGAGVRNASSSRAQEMAELVQSLMSDSPESFRSALVTTLLRFDPDGPEWEILERIYDGIANARNPGE